MCQWGMLPQTTEHEQRVLTGGRLTGGQLSKLPFERNVTPQIET